MLKPHPLKIWITVIISLAILSLLGWQHFHGGVPAHHLLNNKDLPLISNWWGALILPVLTWILIGRIYKRFSGQPTSSTGLPFRTGIFAAGLFAGIALAISFNTDFKPILDYILYIILVLSLFIPIYFSEFILGFVFAMTYTFGALLPTAFILIFAFLGYLLFRYVRPLFLKMF